MELRYRRLQRYISTLQKSTKLGNFPSLSVVPHRPRSYQLSFNLGYSLVGKIHFCLWEVSCADFILEQNINLRERAIFRLRQSEVAYNMILSVFAELGQTLSIDNFYTKKVLHTPYDENSHDATIEEPRLRTPVPPHDLYGTRHQLAIDDHTNIIASSR
jgi:hypothetical protein